MDDIKEINKVTVNELIKMLTEQEFKEFQQLYYRASPFVSEMFKELSRNPRLYKSLNSKLFQNSTIEEDLDNESNLIYLLQNYSEVDDE